MTTATLPKLSDLLRALGGVPPERVILQPLPGTATEADLIRLVDGDEKVLCELVDGTLVEKPVGFPEAQIAAAIIVVLGAFVRERNLGIVAGADAMLRMTGGNVRLPDVCFIAWADLPGGRVPTESIGDFPVTVAIEVLSPSNPKAEMRRKRREYFASGSKQVWEVDLKARMVHVYGSPEEVTSFASHEVLKGGDALPGFELRLADLFAQLDLTRP